MPRIRSIKPEFPQSESMGRVSRDARLTFILLWTIADDSGRLRGNSRMLASLLFPYDDDAPSLICSWLSQLEKEGCIVLYKIGSDNFIQISKWSAHQKIDRPSPSRIPEFDESSRAIVEPSSLDQGSRIKEGIKDQGSLREGKPRRKTAKGLKLEYSEETILCGQELASSFPKEHLNQDGIPSTSLSVLMERTDSAIEEIRKSIPFGDFLSPTEILKAALKLYIEECQQTKRFISGLGVWLSPTPKADKANYRTYLPRAVRVLRESSNG